MKTALTSFSQAFEEVCSTLPSVLAEEAPCPSKEELIDSISFDMQSLRDRAKRGLNLIFSELQNSKDQGVLLQTERLIPLLSSSFSSLLSSTAFTRAVLRVVSGESWREALRIPLDSLNLLYSGARSIFEDGRYEEAIDAFVFLSWFDVRQYDFWMSLGHAQFHTGQYSSAILSYGVAFECRPQESWPEIYSAACFEAMGNSDDARRCILEALRLEREKPSRNFDLLHTLETKLASYQNNADPAIS